MNNENNILQTENILVDALQNGFEPAIELATRAHNEVVKSHLNEESAKILTYEAARAFLDYSFKEFPVNTPYSIREMQMAGAMSKYFLNCIKGNATKDASINKVLQDAIAEYFVHDMHESKHEFTIDSIAIVTTIGLPVEYYDYLENADFSKTFNELVRDVNLLDRPDANIVLQEWVQKNGWEIAELEAAGRVYTPRVVDAYLPEYLNHMTSADRLKLAGSLTDCKSKLSPESYKLLCDKLSHDSNVKVREEAVKQLNNEKVQEQTKAKTKEKGMDI